MPNIFEQVKVDRIKKNVFNLTHDHKTTLTAGNLVPVALMEALPGDTFMLGTEGALRMMPMVAPMMHRVRLYFHWWFVPNRIVWPNWEKFITNTKLPATDLLPAFPTMEIQPADGTTYSRLLNYMGIPDPTLAGAGTPVGEVVSAIPMAGYQAIYNEYYRDQNLVSEIDYQLADGNNPAAKWKTLRKRAWQHDYLTSALPTPQKGEAVDIPLGDVVLNPANAPAAALIRHADDYTTLLSDENLKTDISGQLQGDGVGAEDAVLDPNGSLVVGATTINDLRSAFAIQKMLEKWMRAGSRYAEMLRSFFNIYPEDSRLDRPVFITGNSTPIRISEVLNTTADGTTPQGEMAGHGVVYTEGRAGRYTCKEHGFVMCIASVLPDTAYMQGMPKHFLKYQDPFQYAVSELAHLGEQEILKKEVVAFRPAGNDVFGYTPRFQENRFHNNFITGQMQSVFDYWHWGRIFAGEQSLNQEFIECDPGQRPFAVQTETDDNMIMECVNHVKVVRVLPKFGTPGSY